jgi:hypothetical protein
MLDAVIRSAVSIPRCEQRTTSNMLASDFSTVPPVVAGRPTSPSFSHSLRAVFNAQGHAISDPGCLVPHGDL